MKTSKLFIALAFGAALVACGPKGGDAAVEGEKTAADFKVSKAVKDSVSYLLGINYGTFLKGYDFGDDLNYNEMVKGIKDFMKAEGDFRDPEFNDQFKISPDRINDMFNSYLENRRNMKIAQNKEKEASFLAKNAKDPKVQTTMSGLQYTVIEKGSDVVAGPADTVWVKYKGTLLDGTVFDETKGDEPVQLTLNRVIKGWTEGLQLVGEGGQIKLFIPAELGYGERGTQGIEPYSTLLFDVTVTKVGKVAAE